jgi:hypothetical protein
VRSERELYARAVWRADDGSVQDPAAVRPYRRGMLFRSSTGMPVADAHDDFLRARRAQVAARAARWVAGGRRRWQRIALADRRAASLPPIRVLRGEDGYHVVDGRHGVSVAVALGRRDIDAWVTPVRTVSSSKSAEAA